jgi:hypothetical protein
MVKYGNKVYSFGGESCYVGGSDIGGGLCFHNDIWIYDTITRQWSVLQQPTLQQDPEQYNLW